MLRRRIRVVAKDWLEITSLLEVNLPKVAQTDLHYTNLFEFPLLFSVLVIIMYIDDVDVIILALAWMFVLCDVGIPTSRNFKQI